MRRSAQGSRLVSRWSRWARVIGLACAISSAVPGVARASEDEARERYRVGVDFYGQARYAAALEAFEQAYALHPTAGLLFNLGQTQYQLGEYTKALRALRTYLATADRISPERRADVLEQLDDLKLRTGELAVFVGVSGALISVDGDLVAVSPRPEPILLELGSHRVTVSHSDYVTTARQIEVRAGEVSSLRVQLVPLREEPDHSFQTAAWIAAGGFGALAVASAVVTVVQHREYEQALQSPQGGDAAGAQQALDEQRSRVRGWALATDLLAAASLASCGVAIYARWQSAPSEASKALDGARAPSPTGASVGVAVAF